MKKQNRFYNDIIKYMDYSGHDKKIFGSQTNTLCYTYYNGENDTEYLHIFDPHSDKEMNLKYDGDDTLEFTYSNIIIDMYSDTLTNSDVSINYTDNHKNKQLLPKMSELQNGGHVRIKINNKIYNRSATMIIEKSYKNTNSPTIILFKDRKWDVYINPGGRIDKFYMNPDATLINTAKRELKEESCNLFDIDFDMYKTFEYVDIPHNKKNNYYRLFIFPIDKNIIDMKQ